MIDIKEEVIKLWMQHKSPSDIASELNIPYHTATNYLYRSSEYQNFKKTGKIPSLLTDYSVANRIGKEVQDGKLYTEEELVAEHGFDPNEFRLKSATSNNWGVKSEVDLMNFQHKIEVLPKSLAPTAEDLIGLFNNIEPTKVDLLVEELTQQYLLIPLFDIHFDGHAEYLDLLSRILDIIQNGYEEILIVIGGDYLHVDNFMNTTEKGTNIDPVDFQEMITHGFNFIQSIVIESLKFSPNVKLVYLPGNHAPSNDYILMRWLEHRFEDIECDCQIEEYKHAWLGNHSIFLHHGDKRNKTQQLLNIIVSMYAKEWGESQSRYLITGHLHHETSLSTAGLTHYQVMSPAKSSSYDRAQGYVTSETGLMLFEFNSEKRSAIYYL